MTLEQAKALYHGQEVHYTGRHQCSREVGPRGGVQMNITRARVSGAVQTWKTRPGDVRVPVKHGLHESAAIREYNLGDWHLASECPAQQEVVNAAS